MMEKILENITSKDLSEKLNQKFLEIFPVNDINLISFNVTSRKLVIVTIMKKGGILIDDCKFISSLINQYIPDDYDLQVQSPGIGFEIKRENFIILDLFIDLPVKVFYKDDNVNVKEIEGILTFVGKFISIKMFGKDKNKFSQKAKRNINKGINKSITEDDEGKNIISLPIESIIKVKTTFYPEEI